MKMPALFVGHGNPMNALELNQYSRAWRDLGRSLPRPGLILSVSAHWYLPGTRLTAQEWPRTIHDFGGFPRPLYEVEYPAPGAPAQAERIRDLLAPTRALLDDSWGLDHGTWSVLVHLFPEADVPVVQLSLDETRSAREHYEIALHLCALRDEGVLVFGSGNLVHNLHAYAWGDHSVEPYDWALRFEEQIRTALESGDPEPAVAYERLGRDAALAAPTPDHFLPLLYVLGQWQPSEHVTFPVEGFDGGSVSMLAVQLG